MLQGLHFTARHGVGTSGLRLRRCYDQSGHCVAALALGLPIVRVTIKGDRPLMCRDERYQPDTPEHTRNLALLSLAGPASEVRFCGRITDSGDAIDLANARAYLARWRLDDEYDDLAEAARQFVRASAARRRIRLLARAFLTYGALSAQQVGELVERF
jgi:hypothetical protein